MLGSNEMTVNDNRPKLKSLELPAFDFIICHITSAWPKNTQPKRMIVVAFSFVSFFFFFGGEERLFLLVQSQDLCSPIVATFMLSNTDSCGLACISWSVLCNVVLKFYINAVEQSALRPPLETGLYSVLIWAVFCVDICGLIRTCVVVSSSRRACKLFCAISSSASLAAREKKPGLCARLVFR